MTYLPIILTVATLTISIYSADVSRTSPVIVSEVDAKGNTHGAQSQSSVVQSHSSAEDNDGTVTESKTTITETGTQSKTVVINNGQEKVAPKYPHCDYKLLVDSTDGPAPVSGFVNGDETILHEWTCDEDASDTDYSYCMLIHTCTTTTSDGNTKTTVDDNGCSTDTTNLPNIEYTNDYSANTKVKLNMDPANTMSMQLSCSIRQTVKPTNGECPRPNCN